MPKSANMEETKIAIAGAGPVAQALGKALNANGVEIACVASRNVRHAEIAASFIGNNTRPARYANISRYASHVIIAVSDRAIKPVAEELAKDIGKLRVAVHTCGSYGAELLEPLSTTGVSCGTLHPLQTIRDGQQGSDALNDAAFAVSGETDALRWAEELVNALDGRVLHIKPEMRHLYHAAAVLASNYLAVLLDAAERLMALAGVPKENALPALAPLARTSLNNVIDHGPTNALTGPIVRGDAATVAAHLEAVAHIDPQIADLYKVAGLHALNMALERGLSKTEAENVRQALLGGK